MAEGGQNGGLFLGHGLAHGQVGEGLDVVVEVGVGIVAGHVVETGGMIHLIY